MKRFFKSFGFALNGWKFFFITEKNGQIQLVVAVLVLIASFIFRISHTEWMAVLICMAMVLALEMTNSVLEKLVDFLHPGQHEHVKWIKDVAAGAVLWAAVLSAVIGGIIFLPKIF